MTIRVFDKPTLEMMRKKRREINQRYRDKHHEKILQKKREYARKSESLERQRLLYLQRNEPKIQPYIPKMLTLDDFITKRIG